MSRTPEQQTGGAPRVESPRRFTVVVAIGDLMLGSRAREALKALGMDASVASSAEDLSARLDAGASLFIVHLGAARWDPLEAIRGAKAREIAVLAFGRHTDTETLAAAGKAGADRVVPRSVFAASLPELIRELARGSDGA